MRKEQPQGCGGSTHFRPSRGKMVRLRNTACALLLLGSMKGLETRTAKGPYRKSWLNRLTCFDDVTPSIIAELHPAHRHPGPPRQVTNLESGISHRPSEVEA